MSGDNAPLPFPLFRVRKKAEAVAYETLRDSVIYGYSLGLTELTADSVLLLLSRLEPKIGSVSLEDLLVVAKAYRDKSEACYSSDPELCVHVLAIETLQVMIEESKKST